MSELLPESAKIVDEIALVKTVWTEAINHDPAITYIQTGNQVPGKPSAGAWLSYGLGSENQDLPTYVVLISKYSSKTGAQALFSRLWGPGFLPSQHQGVSLRSTGDPVLYLSDPPGVDRAARRQMLDAVAKLSHKRLAALGDPEIATRIAQYEMAFRMQSSVPDLTDVSKEPESTFDLYGPEARIPGTVWLAGGGIKRGVTYGETDEFSYNIVKDPVHIRDLNATVLRCLGIDHTRLSFKYAGLEQRLTGVEPAKVVDAILV